jgi:hypothetical protein
LDSDVGFVKNVLLVEGLTDAMETFILSHEYAHIVLGHSAGTRVALNLASAGDESAEVNEAAYSWRQEFEADAYGFIIMDEVLKEQAIRNSGSYFKDPLYPFYLYAPRFFFSLMALVENAKAYTETGAPAPGLSKKDIELAEKAVSQMFSDPAPATKLHRNPQKTDSHPPFLLRAAQAGLIERKARSLFFKKAELEPGTRSVYRLSEAFDSAMQVLFDAATPDFESNYKSLAQYSNGARLSGGPTRAAQTSDPLDLSPSAVRGDLKERGIDLSTESAPPVLRDALVEYDFVAGKGENLNSNTQEVLRSIKDLNAAIKLAALQSHVIVRTKDSGARVVYRLIGGGDSLYFNQLTNHTEDDIPIGLYFVWAERGGQPTSSTTAKFKIIQTHTSIDLEEEKP